MKIKLGVFGIGRIGKFHLDNISKMNDKFEVVGIADPYIDDLENVARKYNIKYFSKDYKDILKIDEIDAVIVATSTNTHAQVSIDSARAGKHIFCEKPISTKIEEIEDVIKTVNESNVKFQVGFNRRFDHNFMRIKEHIKKGNIGDTHYVKVSSRDPEPPSLDYVKVSGGIFMDMMIHDFDMARYLVDSEVTEVYAAGSVLINPEIGKLGDIDTAAVTLKFKNGALCQIDNSRQAVYGYDQRVEVFGSKGQAVAYNDQSTNVELFTEDGIKSDKIPFFFLDRYVNAFNTQLEEFYNSIKKDKKPMVNEVDGLKSVEIAIAATKSLRENKPIKL